MTSKKGILGQSWFYILNLVLIFLCVGSLILLIVVYPRIFGDPSAVFSSITDTSKPTLEATVTPSPIFSPTFSRTPRPTSSPTITSTSTRTEIPTMTLTSVGPATLTPARALPLSGNYDLVQWSPEKADDLVKLMNDYPNTLSETQRGEDNQAYFQAFDYAVIAQREALLRFPDASQAQDWNWGLAFNLARMGDASSGTQYAQLVASALNRGETDLSYLYVWFNEHEPRMDLYLVELEPISGYLGNYLLEIQGNGSSFIWLLQSSSGFRTYPLITNFDFINQPQADWLIADLNGNAQDGQEIAIYFSNSPDEYRINPPSVFNLSQIPPQEYPFLPKEKLFNIGMQFINNWKVFPITDNENDLLFVSDVFSACPIRVSRQYHWKGDYFGLVAEDFQIVQDIKTPSYCELIVDHAINNWGAGATVSIMESLIEDFPPEKNMEGQNYPLDAKDEWRYRLGIYYALIGEYDIALQTLMDLVTNPTVFTSTWVKPAREFLEIYQTPQDLYRACLQAKECNPSYAIDHIVDEVPIGSDALNEIRSWGVNTTSSGFFDFDDDDEAERWFTVRYRSQAKLNFWILADYSLGYKALYVGQVNSASPDLEVLEDIYVQEQAIGLKPAILIEHQKAVNLQRFPDTKEPYLVEVPLREEYPNRFLAGLLEGKQSLFAGDSPSEVQKNLSNLEQYPGLLCTGTWSCDPYYYLLGLASELAGDSRAAVEAYHRLWLDYSLSPYTSMARLKLSGDVYVSPTPTVNQTVYTPTGTTPTHTLTPTISGTAPTMTETPIGTITPEETATMTITVIATTSEAYPIGTTPANTPSTAYP